MSIAKFLKILLLVVLASIFLQPTEVSAEVVGGGATDVKILSACPAGWLRLANGDCGKVVIGLFNNTGECPTDWTPTADGRCVYRKMGCAKDLCGPCPANPDGLWEYNPFTGTSTCDSWGQAGVPAQCMSTCLSEVTCTDR